MSIEHIVAALVAERDKLERAIHALGGVEKRKGRPKRGTIILETSASPVTARKKRRVSKAARKKMAEAQRRRWAALKAAK